jgi:arylformamidase
LSALPASLAGLSLQERERGYAPSSAIGGDYRPFIEAYARRSAEVRAKAAALGGRWERIAVDGSATLPAIELCRPPRPLAHPGGLLLFVHGGYWQELSAADSLFAAAACIERGIAFGAIDYTLAPRASVAQIVAECRRALALLVQRADALGIDPQRIVVAGSSAGAQLAAMMACTGPRPAATVLLSGIYWLEPLIGTTINEALGLDLPAARACSPSMQPLKGFPPSLLAWGEIEPPPFRAQSLAFAEQLRTAGIPCQTRELAQRNHFDIVFDLPDLLPPLLNPP